jgi:hypothetical protein
MLTGQVQTRLKKIIDQAQFKIDLKLAHNEELRRAIYIVEVFLQDSGRVCYGGQAINIHLPQKDQFYNPNTALPDYDFFSPDAKGDAKKLMDILNESGYTEISSRIGIHDGTIKIYVNYTPIADITQMIPEFYESIYNKSKIVNGIHYADVLFLRMLMFLELSRPRGQVARWEKVFERLTLLDTAHPLLKCKNGDPYIEHSVESERARPTLVRYMIRNDRVFMGADIHEIYKLSGEGRSAKSRSQFLLHGKAPVVFLSPDANMDATILSNTLHCSKEQVLGYQNILPAMVILRMEKSIIGLIIQEEACHSIITLPLTKGRHLHMASMDTMILFLIGLYYRENSLLMTKESLLCWIRAYIDISNRYKARPTKLFPAVSIDCSGYETTFASLLRAKDARIQAERQHSYATRSRRYNMNRTRKKY